MILNNMRNILKSVTMIGGICVDGSNPYVPSIYPIKNTSGSTVRYLLTSNSNGTSITATPFEKTTTVGLQKNYSSGASTQTCIVFGNGTTPVTEDDYMLESIITSGITLNSYAKTANVSFDEETNKYRKTISITATIKNSGTSDVVVSEVGFYELYYTQSSGNSYKQYVLLHREVFDPVTIAPDGTKTFVFNFEFVTQLV